MYINLASVIVLMQMRVMHESCIRDALREEGVGYHCRDHKLMIVYQLRRACYTNKLVVPVGIGTGFVMSWQT